MIGSRAVPWESRLLRGERVYVKVGSGGKPAPGPDGRVDIVYKPGGKVYRAGAGNLSEDPDPKMLSDSDASPSGAAPEQRDKKDKKSGLEKKSAAPVPGDAIIVYTDGAC